MKLYVALSALVFLSACSVNKNNKQSIFEAIYYGNKDRVVELINNGMDANSTDSKGASLLMIAAFHGKKDIIQWLLTNGVTVDQEDDYEKTALIYAADQGYEDIVALLLEHGADINKVDELSQWKPLDYAAARDREEVVKAMLLLKEKELSLEDRKQAAHKSKNARIKALLLSKKSLE